MIISLSQKILKFLANETDLKIKKDVPIYEIMKGKKIQKPLYYNETLT